jgi:hypothetical protein
MSDRKSQSSQPAASRCAEVSTSELAGEENALPVYEMPRLVTLGRATTLVRQSGQGQLRDGNGGWWVWGS